MKDPVLGGKPIEKTEITPYVTNSDSGTPILDYDRLKKDFPIFNQQSGASYTTPDMPTTKYIKRLGEDKPVLGVDMQEELALDQGAAERWAYFLPRVATKALASAASLPGYMSGFSDWAGTGFSPDAYGESFNNGWISAVDSAEESLKNLLPIYTPKSVAEGGLWKNLGSSAFWANEGADGVGFLVGMLAPGALVKGLKAGEAVQGFWKILKPGFQLSEKLAGKIDDFTAVALNTTFEAANEGVETYRSAMDQYNDPELAGKAAANTFTSNLAILVGPNILQQKWLFNGFNRGKSKAAASLLGRSFDETGAIRETIAPLTKLDKAVKIGKTVGTGVLSEGFFEEGLQNIVSSVSKEGTTPLENLDEVASTYIETALGSGKESTDFWKSVVLGGLLGGGMASVEAVRETKQEDKLSNEYHKLLRSNYINRYTTIADFAVMKDGKPLVDENGNLVIDKEKLAKATKDQLSQTQMTQFMDILKAAGEEEGFEYFKNILDSRYIYPFLQTEGGLDLFKKHAEYLAKKEASQDAEATGIDSGTAERIKNDLIKKAERLQRIYDDVTDSNSITLRNSIKRDAKDNDVFNEFVRELQTSKISTKGAIDFILDRVDGLRDKLNSGKTKVSSTETKLTSKLVDSLKESLAESKKKNNLDEQDISVAERQIADIEQYVADYEDKSKTLKELYNTKENQKAYDKMLADKIKAAELEAKQKSDAQNTKDTTGLSPDLARIYSENVKHETVSLTKEPDTFISDEDLRKQKIVTHRGIVEIPSANTTFYAKVGTKRSDGSLSMQLYEKDGDNFKSTNTRAFLNPNGTLTIGTDIIPVKLRDIKTAKSVEEVRNDTQIEAITNLYNNAIEVSNNIINGHNKRLAILRDRISKINSNIQNVIEKYKDTLTEEEIELRKVRTGSKTEEIRTKRKRAAEQIIKKVIPIYKTVAEARNEINSIESEIRKIEEAVLVEEATVVKYKEGLDKALNLPSSVLSSLNNTYFRLVDEIKNSRKEASDAREDLAGLRQTLRKLMFSLRSLHSDMIEAFNIPIDRDIPTTSKNKFELTVNGKVYEYSRANGKHLYRPKGTESFTPITESQYDNAYSEYFNQLEELGLYADDDLILKYLEEHQLSPENVETNVLTFLYKTDSLSDMLSSRSEILSKIAIVSDMITEQNERFNNFNARVKIARNRLEEFKKFRSEFLKEYKSAIGTFFRIDDFLEKNRYDDSLDKESVLEGKFGTLFVNEQGVVTRIPEESYQKPFDGTVNSFLIPGTDQTEAITNNQTALWFAFVNNYAYKRDIYSIIAVSQKAAKNLSFGKDLKFVDEEDIKLVAVKKDTLEPVMLNDNGSVADNGTNMAVTSMILPKYEYTKRAGDRFSYSKLSKKYKEEHPNATETEIEQYINQTKDKVLTEYKALRDQIKASESPFAFDIEYVTPGVKVEKGADDIDVLDAFDVPNIADNATFVIETPSVNKETGEPIVETVQKKVSNSVFNLTKGYLYMMYKNRYELIKPKTLSETEDVDSIMNLFKFVFTYLHAQKDGKLTAEGEQAELVRKFLTNVLYHNAAPSSASTGEFRLFFRKDGKGKYDGIVFGDNFISKEKLLSNDGIDSFIKFLGNKYWNFNKKLIDETDKSFIEFKGHLDNKGNVKVTEKKHKNYLHFLFPNNVPIQKGVTLKSRGMVYIKPAPKSKDSKLLMAKDPQYTNQGLQLVIPSEKQPDQSTSTTQKKGGVLKTITLPENQTLVEVIDNNGKKHFLILDTVANRFSIPTELGVLSDVGITSSDLVSAELWGSSLRAILRNEDGTAKITSDSKIGDFTIKFYSKEYTTMVGGVEEQVSIAPRETTSKQNKTEMPNWESAPKAVRDGYITIAKKKLPEEATEEEILSIAKKEYDRGRGISSNNKDSKGKTYVERKVTVFDNYERENISAAKEWLRSKFPNMRDEDIEIINGIIENKSWGRVLENGKILLSDIAEVGTAYHEGWHMYSLFFVEDAARTALYDETRARLGNEKLTDTEVEEILAEDFRDFMMMGSAYKFNKITEQKKETLFRKILNFLKRLFNITTEDVDKSLVEKAFNDLRDNSFTNIVSRPKYAPDRIKGLSAATAQAYTEDINSRFLDYLVSTVQDGEDVILNLDESVSDIYESIRLQYETEVAVDPTQYHYKYILKYWNELKEKHAVMLTQYKIDVREEIDEDEQLGRNRNDFIESSTKNIKDEIPSPIRLVIGAMVDTETNPDGEIIVKTKEFYGTEVKIKFQKFMTAINNVAAGSSDINNFYQNLAKLIPQYPTVKGLLRILGNRLENGVVISNENMSKTQFTLRNQMYYGFANNKTIPIIGIATDTGINYVYPVDENEIKVLKRDWINNAIALGRSGKSKYIDNDGKIDKKLLLVDLTNALGRKTTDDIKKVLSQLGIYTNPKKDKTPTNIHVQYVTRLKEELMRNDLGDIFINDLYDRDRIENQKEMDLIAKDAMRGFINDSDLTHQTVSGNLEYGVSRGSHIHEVSDRINSWIESGSDDIPKHISHIFPLDESGKGNLFTINSLMIKAIIEAKRNFNNGNSYNRIDVVKLSGLKDRRDNGKDLNEEEHFDYMYMTTDAILNNVMPMLRAGDRGPEYGIRFLPNENTITRNTFISLLKDYLYDEVITTVALLKNKSAYGGEYEHYKNNARSLRTFGFIEDVTGTVESFVEGRGGKSLNSIKDLTLDYLSEFDDQITKALDGYIDEMMSNNLEELKEWGLIRNYGKDKFVIPGFSQDTLKKLDISIGSDGSINITALNNILMRLAHNYFIGSQEQLKIYLGDIAFFKDGKDFHKRITSHTSTRTKLPNSQDVVDLANTLYPQAFGKHKTTVNSVAWDKIKKKSSTYNRDMDVADGQLWSTLEFARTVKIRQGLWNDKLEAAYMYESQKLALRLLEKGNEDLLEIIDRTADDIREMFISGIFSEHTNKEIPNRPMFNGKYIHIRDMATISTIKPLNLGAEQSATNLFAPVIDKCSIAPLHPSTLGKNALKIYLSALANDVDLFGDTTVKKETYISAGKPGVINKNTPFNTTLFDDMGVQSDMNTEDKERITKSTQMNRVLFVETHDKGELLSEYNTTDIVKLRDEHSSIIKALTKGQLDNLTNELGLEKDERGNYYLNDIDTFKRKLLNMVQSRVMPDSVADGIIAALESSTKSLDILITKKQIESILMALPKHRAISFKVNGEMYAQESSWIYSEDGNPILNFGYKEGNPIEIMIPIPEKWIKYVDPLKYTDKDGNKYYAVDALNKMIEDGKVDERILTITANRIPTAAPNTLEAVRIKKFLPYHVGPRIILPYDIVIKTSSDFDIDKLFTYLNNTKVTKDGLEYIKYLDDSNSTVEQRYEVFYKEEDRRKEELADAVLGIFDGIDTTVKKISLEEFKERPIAEQNTPEAIENRLNEISYQALLMPERREVLLRPHESTTLKKIAEDIAANKPNTPLNNKEKTADKNRQYLTEYWYNARKYKQFQDSKSLVARVASSSSVNNKLQENPIRITNPLLTLYFEGQELSPGQQYINGNLVDTNGYPIYDNFGQFLVAAVDAVKDPYIFELLFSKDVYSLYAFLNKTGINKGVGLKTLAKFLTSPIIVEYLREFAINSSIGMNNSMYESGNDNMKSLVKSKQTILDELFVKYSKDKNISNKVLYKDFESYMYSPEGSAVEADAITDYNRKKSEANYKYLSDEDMSKPENFVQILDTFLMYQRVAGDEVGLQKHLRFDASGSFPKSFSAMDNRLMSYAEFRTKNFNIYDVYKYTNNSYLSAFRDTYFTSNGMFRWSSYILSDEKRKALFDKAVREILINPKNQYFFMRRDAKDMEKALSKIENDLYQYIYMTMKYNKDPKLQEKVYEKLVKGSIAKRFNDLKAKGKLDEIVVKVLRPVIKEYSNTTGKSRENDYITTFTKKHDISDENDLTNAIEDMMNSSDEEVRKFGTGLFELGLVQNGLSGSPISFARYLPPTKYIAEMDKYIKDFFNDPEVFNLIEGFISQFGVVNNSNTLFVPRYHKLAKPILNGRIKIGRQVENELGEINLYLKSGVVGGRYVNIRVQADRATYKAKTRFNRKVPAEYVLFEFVEMSGTGWKDLPMAKYRRVPKQGDSHRFLEYYTTYGGLHKSILNDNLYQESPRRKNIVSAKSTTSSVNFYTGNIEPSENTIFVFGSNPVGINGNPQKGTGGAALVAQQKFGVNQGERMNNRISNSGQAYGLVTVTYPGKKNSISPEGIIRNIKTLYKTAENNSDKQFKIAYRNTTERSLNGYTGLQMIDMFNAAGPIPSNIVFSKEWFDTGKLVNTSVISGTIVDDFGDINAEFSSASNENYQLANTDISQENITDLDNKMKDFLEKIGVSIEEYESLKTKLGDNSVTSIADLINMTVKVVNGEMNIQTLPEEAAHFYVHLLDKNTGLYKSMMTNIANHPIYSEVKDKYKDIYTTEEDFRREAIGQLIAKEIVNQYSANERLERQATTWWNILWNWVKNLFNKKNSDPYVEAAYNILNNKTNELLSTNEEVVKEEVTPAIVNNVDNNIDELSKETGNLNISNLISTFDDIFPGQSWRTAEEKEALIRATLYGRTEVVCGL